MTRTKDSRNNISVVFSSFIFQKFKEFRGPDHNKFANTDSKSILKQAVKIFCSKVKSKNLIHCGVIICGSEIGINQLSCEKAMV